MYFSSCGVMTLGIGVDSELGGPAMPPDQAELLAHCMSALLTYCRLTGKGCDGSGCGVSKRLRSRPTSSIWVLGATGPDTYLEVGFHHELVPLQCCQRVSRKILTFWSI